jgi:hypothetical protein
MSRRKKLDKSSLEQSQHYSYVWFAIILGLAIVGTLLLVFALLAPLSLVPTFREWQY